MKYLLLVVVAGTAGWFYLIDGSRLDEGMVREFYAQQAILKESLRILQRNKRLLGRQARKVVPS